MSLTLKQAQFVREYLVDLNATQAAIRAGYSARTAASIGDENLRKPAIAEAVQTAMAERAERTEITADRVLKELAKVGFANLSDVTDWGIREIAFGFTEDGKKLPLEEIGDAAMVRYADAPFVRPIDREELPEPIRAAVSEVALTKDGFKIKMHDKVGALTQIGRHLGMFTDKVEHAGGVTIVAQAHDEKL
jgi:phage terminase small subunit